MRATYQHRMRLDTKLMRNLQDKLVFASKASVHQRGIMDKEGTYRESPVIGYSECFGNMDSSHCTGTLDKEIGVLTTLP